MQKRSNLSTAIPLDGVHILVSSARNSISDPISLNLCIVQTYSPTTKLLSQTNIDACHRHSFTSFSSSSLCWPSSNGSRWKAECREAERSLVMIVSGCWRAEMFIADICDVSNLLCKTANSPNERPTPPHGPSPVDDDAIKSGVVVGVGQTGVMWLPVCESFAVVRSTFQEKDCRIAMCHKGEGGTECCCVNIHKQVEERERARGRRIRTDRGYTHADVYILLVTKRLLLTWWVIHYPHCHAREG